MDGIGKGLTDYLNIYYTFCSRFSTLKQGFFISPPMLICRKSGWYSKQTGFASQLRSFRRFRKLEIPKSKPPINPQISNGIPKNFKPLGPLVMTNNKVRLRLRVGTDICWNLLGGPSQVHPPSNFQPTFLPFDPQVNLKSRHVCGDLPSRAQNDVLPKFDCMKKFSSFFICNQNVA